jgi:hypothetical protein
VLLGLLYLHTLNEFPVSLQLAKTAGLFKTPPPPPAPSKRNASLLEMAPKKRMKRQEAKIDKSGDVEFSNFKTEFQGYTSHFLKKDSYIILKLSIVKMSLTVFKSLAIFEMDSANQNKARVKIDEVLSSFHTDENIQKINQFENKISDKPFFIRLSPTCLYWRKECGNTFEISEKEIQALKGKCFSGRIALLIKGVTISPDNAIMKPMITVCQMMETKSNAKATKQWEEQCLLDSEEEEEQEEIQPQEHQPQQQQREEDREFTEDLYRFYVNKELPPLPTYSPLDDPKAESYKAEDTLMRATEKPRLNGYSVESDTEDDEGLFE